MSKEALNKVRPNSASRMRDLPLPIADLVAAAKGLADESRMRVFLAVADGPLSVSKIVEQVGLSQPLVSHHLRELRRASLVRVERKGPFVFYQASKPKVMAALKALADLVNDRPAPNTASKAK